MRIVLTYNLKSGSDLDDEVEFDSSETIEAIRAALVSKGHSVHLVEENEELYVRLLSLKSNIDIVFNIAEGRRGEGRESLVPCILDSLGIPYTGSGPTALAITLNKARSKEVLAYYGIPTPPFCIARYPEFGLPVEMDVLTFPVIIKPICEGSSKGITDDCLVNTIQALEKRVLNTGRKFHQNVLIEEYLEGREFTVSIVGNSPPELLPIVELDFSFLPSNMNKFDSYESKWLYDTLENNFPVLVCPASVSAALERTIREVGLKSYNVLECRDFCRMDMRLDAQGIPNVLDVNALPGLMSDPRRNSRFTRAAMAAGYDFSALVNRILDSAVGRI